jgi:hypothetical protein
MIKPTKTDSITFTRKTAIAIITINAIIPIIIVPTVPGQIKKTLMKVMWKELMSIIRV